MPTTSSTNLLIVIHVNGNQSCHYTRTSFNDERMFPNNLHTYLYLITAFSMSISIIYVTSVALRGLTINNLCLNVKKHHYHSNLVISKN